MLYIGEAPVPHAADALEQSAAAFGIRRAYITNNASRTPEQVVDVLAGVGVPADVSEVVTSAQVAAAYLAGQIAPGMPSWLWAVRAWNEHWKLTGYVRFGLWKTNQPQWSRDFIRMSVGAIWQLLRQL